MADSQLPDQAAGPVPQSPVPGPVTEDSTKGPESETTTATPDQAAGQEGQTKGSKPTPSPTTTTTSSPTETPTTVAETAPKSPDSEAGDEEGRPSDDPVSLCMSAVAKGTDVPSTEDTDALWKLLLELAESENGKHKDKHIIGDDQIIFNEKEDKKRVTINKAANGSISISTETPATRQNINELFNLLTKLAQRSEKPVTFTINNGSLKSVKNLLEKLESSKVKIVFSATYIEKLKNLSQHGTIQEQSIAKKLLERHRQQSQLQGRRFDDIMEQPRGPQDVTSPHANVEQKAQPIPTRALSAPASSLESMTGSSAPASESSIDQAEQDRLRGQLESRIELVSEYIENIENPDPQLGTILQGLEDMRKQVEETGGLKPEQCKQLKDLYTKIDSIITTHQVQPKKP